MKAIITLIFFSLTLTICSGQYYGTSTWKQTGGGEHIKAAVKGDTLYLSKAMKIEYVQARTKNIFSETPIKLFYQEHISYCGDEIIFYKMNLSKEDRFSKIIVIGKVGDLEVEVTIEKSVNLLTKN
jgi:hypothetical protein